MPESLSTVAGGPAFSRRQVLISSAWAAPVVAVAAATPLAAASGGDIEIRFDNFWAGKIWETENPPFNWGGATGNLQISRDGVGAEFLTQLTVTITIDSRLGLTGDVGEVSIVGSSSAWSVLSASVGDSVSVYTFFGVGALGRWSTTGMLTFKIPTTIEATMADIGSFHMTAHVDSPDVVSSITRTEFVV